MIKLKEIAQSVIKEGGKAFGDRAKRMTTAEMAIVFQDLKKKIGDNFGKFEMAKSLPAKTDHGDLDIVVINDRGMNIEQFMRQEYNAAIQDYLKNGNVYSFLFYSDSLHRSIHVDLISVSSVEDFLPQYEYLNYGDFSGILGVMARRLHFNYGTEGMYKIYIDKSNRYHYILITKNLREGLQILGYKDILDTFDNIKTLDDIVKFITASPLFSSEFYQSMGMNNSDRKRTRIGRPSADYIRNALKAANIQSTIADEDYFLKNLYPTYYSAIQAKAKEIEDYVFISAKYGGEWILKNFPNLKAGPIIGKIKQHWKALYGDSINSVDEKDVYADTAKYLALFNTK
jgi:hypothetical protein